MEKMTLHRALAELKLIDKKINKLINGIVPVGIMQKGKLVNGSYSKDEFEKEAKAKYQSIEDLIKRKETIKTAIVKANVSTLIKVGDNEMTIAEAINRKTIIELQKGLVNKLSREYGQVVANQEANNKKVEDNAIHLAEVSLGKDNVKVNDGDAVSFTKPYIDANEFHLVDPLGAEKLAEKLDNEISEFESEIDAVLSEANAVTVIEI